MLRYRIGLAAFLSALYVLEGTLWPWWFSGPLAGFVHYTPHLVLAGILFISLYWNRHMGLLYGVVFGMLHDIAYYGYMVGIYAFATGLTAYIAGMGFRRKYLTVPKSLLIVAAGMLFFDMTVIGMYRLFGIAEESLHWIVLRGIVPSVLLNSAFACLLYFPVTRLVDGIVRLPEEDEGAY